MQLSYYTSCYCKYYIKFCWESAALNGELTFVNFLKAGMSELLINIHSHLV